MSKRGLAQSIRAFGVEHQCAGAQWLERRTRHVRCCAHLCAEETRLARAGLNKICWDVNYGDKRCSSVRSFPAHGTHNR